MFGSTEPCVPSCQYCIALPSAFFTLASALMCVKLASKLSAKPPRPVVRAGWKAGGAMAKPSSDIMFAQAALAGRHGNDRMSRRRRGRDSPGSPRGSGRSAPRGARARRDRPRCPAGRERSGVGSMPAAHATGRRGEGGEADAAASATFELSARGLRVSGSFNWRGYGLRAPSVKVLAEPARKNARRPKERPAVGNLRLPRLPRLRAALVTTPLHIVLVEPEIPPNTGQHRPPLRRDRLAAPPRRAPRLPHRRAQRCAAPASTTGTSSTSASTSTSRTSSTPVAARSPAGRLHLFSAASPRGATSTRASRRRRARLRQGERRPRPTSCSRAYADRVVGIPTLGAVRSLNLANAVGIALFEALRQTGALDATFSG